ncbi:HK97 gp10 family phage protein [Spirillospora sp. NBC_00431]
MARRSRGITVDISGLRQARGRLEELPEELRGACQRAIADGAEAVKEKTEQLVPVDTGHLARNVRVRRRERGLSADVGWFDKKSYYAAFVEHGTESQSAQPSLGPALEEERPELPRRIRAEIRRLFGR